MPKILCAQGDHNTDAAEVRALLTAGYLCTTSANADAAIERARCGDIDMVVVRDLDAPEAARVVQRLHLAHRQIPVLVLSSAASEYTVVDAFRDGAVDYLPPQFRIDEFLARIRLHLRRSSSRRCQSASA